MNSGEFEKLRQTFPWREHVFGPRVMVLDKNNQEVPIFTMTAFLAFITNKLAASEQKEEKAA